MSIIGTNGIIMSVSSLLGLGSEEKIFDIFSFIGVIKTGKIDQLKSKEVILNTLMNWAKSNYFLCDDNTYWKAGDDQILIPIQLKTLDNVILDNVVLVFNIDRKEITKYSGNLSGFHIEAITRNKNLLAQLGDTDKIRKSILPSSGKGRPVDLGWSFETTFGSFDMSASLVDGKTSISSALYVDNEAVWESSFLSDSPLVHNYSTTI